MSSIGIPRSASVNPQTAGYWYGRYHDHLGGLRAVTSQTSGGDPTAEAVTCQPYGESITVVATMDETFAAGFGVCQPDCRGDSLLN